ncbi:hypothetical protein, partial [Pseudomonas sp.]|uniref:hypothetical protein n=1 Tax=Pseudomonas sp. TaxID=306 RepID=UPI0028A8B7A9
MAIDLWILFYPRRMQGFSAWRGIGAKDAEHGRRWSSQPLAVSPTLASSPIIMAQSRAPAPWTIGRYATVGGWHP